MIKLDAILDYTSDTKDLDIISLSRMEMQRSRIRRQSKKGYDVGIDLPAGTTLYDGAVLQGDGHTVAIQQIPELVIAIHVPTDIEPPTLVLLGHTLGNLHRPINIQNNSILLPIQDVTEETTFRHMLSSLDIHDISVEKQIFVPHSNANVSGHA